MKTCPRCKGEGYIKKEYLRFRFFGGSKYESVEITCPRCGGEGKVETDFFDEVDRAYDEIKHSKN
ncbi:MAG: hypothetical protein WCY05_06255 [Candidatus Omnitrophota bacterium]